MVPSRHSSCVLWLEERKTTPTHQQCPQCGFPALANVCLRTSKGSKLARQHRPRNSWDRKVLSILWYQRVHPQLGQHQISLREQPGAEGHHISSTSQANTGKLLLVPRRPAWHHLHVSASTQCPAHFWHVWNDTSANQAAFLHASCEQGERFPWGWCKYFCRIK